MASEAPSVWDGEEGGWPEYEFTINSSRFQYDPEWMDGKTPHLMLRGSKVNTETGEVDDAGWLRVKCSEAWEPKPDGSGIVHESGNKDKRFNVKSYIFRFMQDLVACAEAAGVDIRALGHTPYDAALYDGWTLKMERQEIGSFTVREGPDKGKEMTYSWDLPVAVVKAPGGQVIAGGSGAVAGNGKTAAEGPGVQELISLAKGSSDYLAFLDQATRKYGLQVTDPMLHEKNGVWAMAHAAS